MSMAAGRVAFGVEYRINDKWPYRAPDNLSCGTLP